MWLEGSARKAPAQRAPFAETPVCLPHCLPQRDFLASFCNRKIQKVIVPSAQTEIFARQVSALPPTYVRFVPIADIQGLPGTTPLANSNERSSTGQNNPDFGEQAPLRIDLYRPAMLLDDDVMTDG